MREGEIWDGQTARRVRNPKKLRGKDRTTYEREDLVRNRRFAGHATSTGPSALMTHSEVDKPSGIVLRALFGGGRASGTDDAEDPLQPASEIYAAPRARSCKFLAALGPASRPDASTAVCPSLTNPADVASSMRVTPAR